MLRVCFRYTDSENCKLPLTSTSQPAFEGPKRLPEGPTGWPSLVSDRENAVMGTYVNVVYSSTTSVTLSPPVNVEYF